MEGLLRDGRYGSKRRHEMANWNRSFVRVTAASAQADLIGRASIIDGDTLEIHGARIRL
jgi:endonuclease YncB( thermonuclease family)